MTKPKDGGNAFPALENKTGRVSTLPGMTLRDWLAGQAMMGLLDNYRSEDFRPYEGLAEHTARQSYQFADAMIAEREKTE